LLPSSSVNSTELVFATGSTDTAVEKLRITSDGKVGIGTSVPVTDLTIEGTITLKEKADAEAKKKNTGDALITQGLSNGVPTGFDINKDMTAGGVAGGGPPPAAPAGTFDCFLLLLSFFFFSLFFI
jgi:hypothetical protein